MSDRKWVEENLGFDPLSNPPPKETYTSEKVYRSSLLKTATSEDYAREIIDFDSQGAEGAAFLAFSTATGLSRFTDIPWPKGLEPKIAPELIPKRKGSTLPQADVLVVTWTVDEGHALSRVLTPGKDSRNDYLPYVSHFKKLAPKFRRGCPVLEAGMLGTWYPTSISGKSVIVFKSDSHMSQDGPKLPNIDVWKQIIAEVQPKLVITTGTAGGIGAQFEVGDVIVSPNVQFDCQAKFKNKSFADKTYCSVIADKKYFSEALALMRTNATQLPKTNARMPQIITPDNIIGSFGGVITTDFFGFDTSDNHYKLQGLGDVSEMGDAILGMVCSEMENPPRWLAIRNVSDPQIKAEGTLEDQVKIAAQIYKGYGRWSSVCSAIACWAVIAAEEK